MQLERFGGRDLSEAMRRVRQALGEDAMVLRTETVRTSGGRLVEIVATSREEVEAFRRRLRDVGDSPWPSPKGEADRSPYVLALVGPGGSGKTLSAVKLALSREALGGESVGILSLDTYRVGAVEELQTYSEVAGLPLEIVYGRRELPGALERLGGCRYVVVDTPGRLPDPGGRPAPWEELLAAVEPREVHLVLPAGLRTEVARGIRQACERTGVTHLLPTKLDLVPGEGGLVEMAETLDLPMRWVADGIAVPSALRAAGPRILAALGGGAPGAGSPTVRAAG